MKRWWCLFAVTVLGVVLLAGCGSSTNPFKGSWVNDAGVVFTFESSTWTDSKGDSGTYDYTGTDPEYALTMTTGTLTLNRHATFIDKNTMQLCTALPSGALIDCATLARDVTLIPS
jgi:hypothetical protein